MNLSPTIQRFNGSTVQRFAIGILLCLLHIPAFGAAEKSADLPPPRTYIIGLSPYLPNSAKDDVYRGIVRLLVQDLPLNSTLSIYDAFELKTITQTVLPTARVFDSPKTRANQFASAIRELKQFLAQTPPRPTNGHLTFEAAVRLPQFLDFLSENLSRTNSKPVLLLIGSPLYQDAKEPAFSMVDGYFPSDGHLRASRDQSIFGFNNSSEAVSALLVNWVYFGDPWVNDLYKEKITRFWSLYLQKREAQLAAFTSDLPTALQSFVGAAPGAFASRWTPDAEQTKIEMLRISRKVDVADWLTRGTLSDMSQVPPSTMTGPMKIGIRWKANIDLDLYATPRSEAETLFFQHTRSPEGYYYKDHRHSPGKEYEFIEFETPVDVREVEAHINFYKGSCPDGPQGEVRIEFDGRIYGAPFSISAEEGNLGRSGRSQQQYWTRIPVLELLKINSVSNRGG